MIDLQIQDKRGNIIRHQLGEGKHILGKSTRSDIILMDTYVSRHHADIIVTRDGVYLIDNKSTNGTWVNETRINAGVKLEEGESFRIGNHTLSVSKSYYFYAVRKGRPFKPEEIEMPARKKSNVIILPVKRVC
ncbi:MAG TPA: FHA domain-containing protein [Gammaproteobacteria bacterium]|nr:FHA domain-containing protein [Gammaproteobacteria bacterium]